MIAAGLNSLDELDALEALEKERLENGIILLEVVVEDLKKLGEEFSVQL